MFNVKLEAFDAAAKPKIIREVKAMVPNLTLIEVCVHVPLPRPFGTLHTAVNAKRSADHASLSSLSHAPCCTYRHNRRRSSSSHYRRCSRRASRRRTPRSSKRRSPTSARRSRSSERPALALASTHRSLRATRAACCMLHMWCMRVSGHVITSNRTAIYTNGHATASAPPCVPVRVLRVGARDQKRKVEGLSSVQCAMRIVGPPFCHGSRLSGVYSL